MTSRRDFVLAGTAVAAAAGVPTSRAATTGKTKDDRTAWLIHLQRVAEPVMQHMADGTLQKAMPVEAIASVKSEREKAMHLEAVGRLLCGIAPWLELEDDAQTTTAESALKKRYRMLALEGIERGVNTSSPSYLRFGVTSQTLVDSSFLALALLRAPKRLMHAMDATTKKRFAEAMRVERAVKPGMNNWLLFSAMNEACLFAMGEEWKREIVDFALENHRRWYLGDGTYGDGPVLHRDYYNSFVIQPYLLQIFETLGHAMPHWSEFAKAEVRHAQRYAMEQEKIIGGDGSYPAIGRSITYRCGAFHLLADVALRRMLPGSLPPNQVRCAMSAAIHRTLGAPKTYDSKGWLQIGLAGHQPSLGETYISTGSLYLCSAAFLPLGLPAGDVFWSGPSLPWTQKKVWAGEDFPADHAQD